MTIAQIYEKAKQQLDKDEITIGEFSEIVDREFQEQQPCEDCISREAVIKIFGEVHPMDYNTQAYITNIQNLPSVTPTRPKGKWIQTKDDCDGVNFYDFSFECSKCGKEQSFKSTFCPICGAYMREVKE